MKIQLFLGTPSAAGAYLLRLKDGVYDRVLVLQSPCTAKGMPVSQTWARHLDKAVYCPLITSPHIGQLEYGMPADAEIYTAEEVRAIDKGSRK